MVPNGSFRVPKDSLRCLRVPYISLGFVTFLGFKIVSYFLWSFRFILFRVPNSNIHCMQMEDLKMGSQLILGMYKHTLYIIIANICHIYNMPIARRLH